MTDNNEKVIPNVDSKSKEERNVPDLGIMTELKNVADIFDGTHQTPEYKDSGIPFVSVENIDDIYNYNKFISIDAYTKEFSKNHPEQNDILMTRIGDIGTPAFVTRSEDMGYYVSLALLKPKNINNKYLYYYIQTSYFQHELWKKTIHVAFPKKINKEDIGECKIFLPDLPYQNKIVSLFDRLEARILTQKKIIEDYELLINQLNNNHFNNINKYKIFSEIYEKAKEGGTPDTKKQEYYYNGSIPFIKIDNLYEKYITKNDSYISESGLKNSSAWLIPTNSVIYSNGATIGEVSINTYPICTKQGILGIIPNNKILTEYLYYLLKSTYFKKQIARITTKGTMDAAYLKDIDQIKCPIDCIDEQKKHILNMNLIFEKIKYEKKILLAYEKQKQYLLNHMFI